MSRRESNVIGKLISAVTDDASKSIEAGSPPAYSADNGTFIVIHPSAQQDGMIQVTRYAENGVFGDSQYNNVEDAIRDNGVWMKRRMTEAEATDALGTSAKAEAEYEKRKSAEATKAANREKTAEPQKTDSALQNRDRGRAASVNQMQSIARNPDYMRLGPSRTPDSGAPMVFAVGNDLSGIPAENFGASDVAVMADGQRVPFRYAVIDASRVQPSNFADGMANPAFASNERGTIKALNNGRTAGIRAAHSAGNADAYVGEMIEDGAHGVSSEAIRNTPNPMLVRVYAEDANTDNMAAKSQGQGLGMSASERAAQDAELMTGDVLDKFAPLDIAAAGNRDFVRAFVGKLPENELADMMDATGNLSQDGRRRIEAALLTAAYGKSDLVQELFESTDTDIKAIGNALKVVSGQWAIMRQAAKDGVIDPAVDMTGNLMEAVNIIRRSRAEGSSVAELAGQGDLMGGNYLNELSELFLRIFYRGAMYDRARSGEKVITGLQDVVTSAMNTKADAGLFGDSFKPTPKQIVQSARNKIDDKDQPASQSALFGANGQATAAGQGNRGEGAAQPGEVGQRSVSTTSGESAGKQAKPVAKETSGKAAQKFSPLSREFEYRGVTWRITVHESQWQDGAISWTGEKNVRGVWEKVPGDDIPEVVAKKASDFYQNVRDAQDGKSAGQLFGADESAQPVKAAEAKAVEPWKITQAEYVAYQESIWYPHDNTTKEFPAAYWSRAHKDRVEEAIAEGKPVPANILADYPDLKPAAVNTESKSAVDAEKVAETNDRDHFTLERLNRDTNQMEPVAFKRGEYVRYILSGNSESFGEIDGISHARREFSVDGLWYPFGAAYKAERPAEAKPETVPLSSVIEKVNAKHGEGLTDADRVPKQYNTLDAIDTAIEGLYDGTLSIEDYKAAFRGLMANKEAIVAELGKLTKDQLLRRVGKKMYGGSETKPELVTRTFDATRNTFGLRREYGRNSWTMGPGQYEKYVADNLAALTALVEGSAAEDLKAFADEIDKTRAARQEKVEAAKDPKTLEDFENAIRLKKSEGLDFNAARMSLAPEQRAEFDRLRGMKSRDERKARADQQKTEVRVASQTTDGQVIETKHTKTGEPLFVVKAAERVERDVYNLWNATAKRMGGHYSSFRGNGAVPGFQFKTRESADAFIAFIGGNAAAAKEVVQERRDSFADDKSQSAVERLNEMADRMDERADESLGRERKANTQRRARFAAAAEAAANAEKAMATTMRRIAEAIANGTAQFLDRVRQKAQIEYLSATLRAAKDKETREKYPSYADQEKHRGENPTAATADYAEFPQYTMMRSDIANLARKLVVLPKMKLLGQRILKIADDTSEAYNKFAKDNLLAVSRFGKADGSGFATFSTVKDAERSIEISDLGAVAVPLQIKRGEYRIVLSPSEAINRGIWKGDDRKITLPPDMGAEIVEKLGRLNRRAGARRGMNAPPEAPWQFENAYNAAKLLAAMGIENPWEFRAMLREFANLKEAPKERDKIKEMERAMIGRKNDGLDFFPTPEETAKAMIDAAEISEGMSVLEPSAGMGHIAEQVRGYGVDPDVIEFNGDRRELLEAKGFNVVGSDFLAMTPRGFTFGDVFRDKDGVEGIMRGSGGMGSGRVGFIPLGKDERQSEWRDRDELEGVRKNGINSGYDRIIMNPPFSNRRDAEHVQHAYTLLRPGGRIVAIMGEGVFFGTDKKAQQFRDWLEEVGGTSEKLDEGTFMDPSLPVNTATNARMVVINKPKTDNGVALYSKSGNATQTIAISRQQAESRIKSILGDKLGKVLIDSGIVSFTNNGDEYEGATYKDGSIVLNLDALNDGNFAGVFAHEGFHSAIRDLVGEQTYAQLMKRLDNMRALGNGGQWFKDAIASVPAGTRTEHVTEEIAAYAVQGYVNGERQPNVITRWVESLLSALRTAIIRRLPSGKLKEWAVNNIQPQDLANLAIAGLKAKAGKVAATSYAPAGYAGARTSKTQERTVRSVVPGASEPMRYGEAGGKVSIKDFNAFVNAFKARQPVDNYGYQRKINELIEEIETDWSNGNSDEYSREFGPDKIYADLHKEHGAEYFDGDGDLTDSGARRYSELERKLSTQIAKDETGEPERQTILLNKAGDMAKVVHAYLEKLGLDPSVISGSGKSDSKYFSVEINGEQKTVRVSDHQIPVEYQDRNGVSDYEISLYDVGDEMRRDGRMESAGISEYEAASRAANVINEMLQAHGREAMAYSKINQTDTPAFKKWFGDSKVVDADGEPLVVYHGTTRDFTAFDQSTLGEKTGAADARAGFFFAGNPRAADQFTWEGGEKSGHIMPVYLSMQNPFVSSHALNGATGTAAGRIINEAKANGHDGVIFENSDMLGNTGPTYVVFRPEQIKSAIGNNGDFDGANPDIRYSRAKIIGDSGRQYDQTQRQFFKNVGRDIEKKNLVERTTEYLKNDFWKKMAVGIVDQFRGLRDLGDNGQAYMLARLSKGTAGAFDALLHHGKLSIRDGVYDADTSGGFIDRLGTPLHGELDDFLWYVAANRAEGLSQQDRENLFSPQDIAAGKSLAKGQTNFDYTIQTGPQKGTTTRNRTLIYADANRVFNEFQKNTLDMAEQSGLIDGASRKLWESEFYVPFYRVSEEDGEFIGAKMGNALVRQQAFKKLKGGTDKLNSDLLSNTLLNFSHLIEASAKNRAAKASLAAAEKIGAADRVAPDMASYAASNGSMLPPGTKGTVWFQENGKKVEYKVSDPFVMTAITSLEYAGMRNGVMDVMTKFKHFLTIGVTASPAFKVRNLIRDSIQSIGASELGYNPIKNITEGYKQTRRDSQEYVSALASGALIRFGTMLEGSESARVRQLVKSGVKDSTILNSENKWRAFYDQYLEPAVSAYNELGNRSEEINRAALYNQLVKQGKSHAEAALLARDLMDFSMQGSFNTIRFLTQVVPFMNARLQGMYKLGRAAKDNPRKLAVVTGAVAMASIALMLAYGDDDDWKRREDWDRDNFWWFKLGGIEFRIPKPFEIGAIATLAERGLELMIDDEMTGERFRRVVNSLAMNNLSMNPIPQAFKPILDLYANKDSFTGRPIESMGMERLDPTERFNSNTTMVARGLSSASLGALSPVQFDHLTRSYFGWLGSFVIGGADMAMRAMSDEPTKPALDYFRFGTQGILKEAGTGGSRYVTQVYEQAKELEQAHATWRQMLKDGRIEEAKDYAADNRDKLIRYRQVEAVKRTESNLNERIRRIERSDMDSSEKKNAIALVNKQKEAVAMRIAPGIQYGP